MGIHHDVEEGLEKYEITKIDGQPTDEDLNLLAKRLTNAAGSVATQNGGGEHGHIGMVVEKAKYITFSRNGDRFLAPTNLISNIQWPWDGIETPVAHFARGDKYERQLLKAGQAKKPTLQLAFALSTFQASGEFEPALREWEAKPKADQTFVNFRVFVRKEFGKHTKQNKTTAKSVGHGIANSITDKEIEQIEQLEAQALFIAELANSMQEQSQKQFKEMMELFTANLDAKTSPNPS